MNKNVFLYGFFLVCGVALLLYAVKKMQTSNELSASGVKTMATLVEIKKTTDINGMDLFQPVFEFSDASNKTVRYNYEQMSNPPTWAVGQKMAVVYNPKNTAEVQLDKGWDLVGTPTLFFLLGLFLVIIALRHFFMP
ncbi:MAG: hypothetical protein RLZZ628_2271 [Bacteroidota bacterium]|jgi:hypothetical protein